MISTLMEKLPTTTKGRIAAAIVAVIALIVIVQLFILALKATVIVALALFAIVVASFFFPNQKSAGKLRGAIFDLVCKALTGFIRIFVKEEKKKREKKDNDDGDDDD